MKTPIVNERIPCWPRESRPIETALILTIILVCVGLFCLAIHIPAMAKVLMAGIWEVMR